MTRINTVPVQELTNQHLLAEYKEIVRSFSLVRNAQAKGVNKYNLHSKYKVPSEYTLGTGHVLFFYNKLSYLLKRYNALQPLANSFVRLSYKGTSVLDFCVSGKTERRVYDDVNTLVKFSLLKLIVDIESTLNNC